MIDIKLIVYYWYIWWYNENHTGDGTVHDDTYKWSWWIQQNYDDANVDHSKGKQKYNKNDDNGNDD